MYALLQRIRNVVEPYLPMMPATGVRFERATSLRLMVTPKTKVTVNCNQQTLDLVVINTWHKLGRPRTYAKHVSQGQLTVGFGNETVANEAMRICGQPSLLGSPPAKMRVVADDKLLAESDPVIRLTPPGHLYEVVVYVRSGMRVVVELVE